MVNGTTNGPGGVGTRIACTFKGGAWVVDAVIQNQGDFTDGAGEAFFYDSA